MQNSNEAGGGKNSNIGHILEQDLIQDALEKKAKTTYFDMTLPNTRNELKVAIWVSGTPEQFLMHVLTAVQPCKQMGLQANSTRPHRPLN